MRLVIFMLFFAVLGHAQDAKVERSIDGVPLFDMEKVVEVEGARLELFQRMRKVLLEIYPKSWVSIQDKEDGVILVKASEQYSQKKKIWGGFELSEGWIRYRVQMMVKDGKYKYKISSFIHQADKPFGYIHRGENGLVLRGTSKFWRDKVWEDLQGNVEEIVRIVSGSIELGMKEEEKEW